MEIELLTAPPISGTIAERHFDSRGDCLWVRFDPDDDLPWVGVFGRGDVAPHSGVTPFSDGRHALIIAGGRGYVVDVSSGELRYRTETDLLVGALTIPERDFVVACTWTDLAVLGVEREFWRECVALDGIELRWSTPSELRGEAWQGDGWYAFTLQYDTWIVREGARTRAE